MTPQQKIEQRLLSLDPTYSDFIVSDYFVEICSVFADAHSLDDNNSASLENGFVLLMTFFLDRAEFVVFTEQECGITRGEGRFLVEGFLQSLPTPIINSYEKIYPEAFAPANNNELESEILEAEAVLNNIPKPFPRPQENVYTSTQSAILSEAKAVPTPIAVPPKSPTTDSPRWDSEQ